MKHILTLMIAAASLCGTAFSQTTTTAIDTANLKKYKDLIGEKPLSQHGLFVVHHSGDRYFFELGKELLGRDMLIVSRLSKSGADMHPFMSGYAGDEINDDVVRFEEGPNKKIFIRRILNSEYSKDSTMPLYQSVQNNNIQPIMAAFDVKAVNPESGALVVDLTDYISSDNELFFFDPGAKAEMKLAQMIPDRSYIETVRSFPKNIDIVTVKTYARAPVEQRNAPPLPGGFSTVEINTSLILLPAQPMQARYADARVGYFAVGHTDFDLNPNGVKRIDLIKRWKLEPRAGDMQKYLRGELVEPVKPIVYYIDPATPKKWVPYLMLGVEDWQKAFEQAGFKNAIQARRAPTVAEDSTWSLEDARFSAIVYKPSSVANASGPSISDPRSGEILESHINWYHSVMELLHDWYMIQASPSDPRARRPVFDDSLMGQLIRFVSSHEVGHTLGLLHNFGSSSTVPVDSLRNKAWVEAHGHTPSIMDYARFNYVAQPGDNISEAGLFPRIGDYDKWAIEWGYRLLPQFGSAEAEKGYVNKWIIEKTKNKRLWFGSELENADPRDQSEALGDDAMKAGEYGIKNLRFVLAHLPDWTKQPDEGYEGLQHVYDGVVTQYQRYMFHVLRNVGGAYVTPKSVEEPGAVYEPVPREIQTRAMGFLAEHVLASSGPGFLLDKNILSRIGEEPVDIMKRLQFSVVGALLSPGLLNRVTAQGGLTEHFLGLKTAVWAAMWNSDIYRRNLQAFYITNLLIVAGLEKAVAMSGQAPAVPVAPDAAAVARAQLRELSKEIKLSMPVVRDLLVRDHLAACSDRIEAAFRAK